MRSYAVTITASSLLAIVSGAPIFARDNTCGVAPGGTDTKNQPIHQPSDIKTSADCQTQCHENSKCQSFCFGLVDNVIQCKLFSCAASAVPVQPSANLVVYDKACSGVPSEVPTSNDPTGTMGHQEKSSDIKPASQPQSTPQSQKYQQKAAGNDDNDINAHGQQKPSPNPTPYRPENVPQDQGQQKKPIPTSTLAIPHPESPEQGEKHDEQKKPSPTPTPTPTPIPDARDPKISPVVENKHQQEQKPIPTPTPTPAAQHPKNAHQPQEQQKQKPSPAPTPIVPRPQSTPHAQQQTQQHTPQQNKQNSSSSKANTCGSKPAGTAAHEPFATPSTISVDSCKAQCIARSDCKSFACGVVNNSFVCKLYTVESSSIPAPKDVAQKLNIVAYDVGCSV